MKKERIREKGQVIEAFPNLLFKVKLENGREILAHLGGKMKLYRIKVLPGDKVLVDDAIYEQDSQISCFGKPEDRVSEFNCQGSIKIKGLGFKLADLKEFATQIVLNKIPSEKSFWSDSLKLNFSPQTLIPEKGKMILNLEIEVETYTEISNAALISQIKGLSKPEIEKVVSENWPQVENIEFKFWPFWIKKAPFNPERIKIKLIP